MKILFLGYSDSPLIQFLQKSGDEIFMVTDRIDASFLEKIRPDFIISYGYRYIIKQDIIDMYPNKIINLHISYLPWNRGADPNFWSFIDHTPKGVTIHYIDEGIDTGDIIAQKEVLFSKTETLKTSYEKLQKEIQELFCFYWEGIRNGTYVSKKQEGEGSFHKIKDKESLLHLFTRGWDTPTAVLVAYKNKKAKP